MGRLGHNLSENRQEKGKTLREIERKIAELEAELRKLSGGGKNRMGRLGRNLSENRQRVLVENPLMYRRKHDYHAATKIDFSFLRGQLERAGFAHIESERDGEFEWMRFISPASTAILMANYTDKTRTVETYLLSPYETVLEIAPL